MAAENRYDTIRYDNFIYTRYFHQSIKLIIYSNVNNEMEYNGVNSGDQTAVAEMLNSFFTEIGPSLSTDLTEVDKSFEEFLTETEKKFFFLKKQHQHMFLHYYQSFVSQRRLD